MCLRAMRCLFPKMGPRRSGRCSLPAGQRIYGGTVPLLFRERFGRADNSGRAIAWVTSRPMAHAGQAWLALGEAQSATGLVPVLIPPGEDASESGITENFGFSGTQDVSLIESMSAQTVLEAAWDMGEAFLDPYLAEERAPFGAAFPGLAPAEGTRLAESTLRAAVTAEGPAFLGLVAARRPADIPAAVGWSVFGSDAPWTPQARCLEISAVLRSWEDRFGARLLRIGFDSVLRVLVERPPRTLEAALRVAAEHIVFADQCGDDSAGTVREVAELLVGEPVWRFWWD